MHRTTLAVGFALACLLAATSAVDSLVAPSRPELVPRERLNPDPANLVRAPQLNAEPLSAAAISDLKKKKHLLEKELRQINHDLASAGALHHAAVESEPTPAPVNSAPAPAKAERTRREQTFTSAFMASIAMIIASELGDKTFFIAAIMAMRHSRVVVFTSAIAALALMTVLSSMLGVAVPQLLPKQYVSFASTLLFFVFGVKLLKESYEMDPSEPNEELDEVEMEVDKKELESSSDDIEGGYRRSSNGSFFSPIFMQCFTMTFLAEWGDRSQIATIAMAAAKDPYGVTVGGIIGHSLCTGLAVVGGKVLATSISERSVAAIGGLLFLVFGLHGYYSGDMDISDVQ